VSLGHSSPTRGEPGFDSAVPPGTDRGEAAAKVLEPNLAEDVVPMRAAAERELDREREERIRAVVAGRRRALPRPSSRGRAIGTIGLAAILLTVAFVTALSGVGGNPHSQGQAVTAQHAGAASGFRRKLHTEASSLRRHRAAAHTRRRAAIRAKRRPVRKLSAHRSEPAPQSSKQYAAAPSEASSAEAPETAATSTPVAPTSTQSSTSPSPTQKEFGFER
jgi:hypothetical protein